MKSAGIRVGILGASRIAPRAMIVPASNRGDIAVTCIAARDQRRADLFALKHGIANVARNYADLIARDNIDLIYVGLPPSEHLRCVVASLAAGKAVLCEKPLAVHEEDARIMVAASERHGRPLLEAFHYRFHAAFRSFEMLLADLGPIRSASASFCMPVQRRRHDIRWNPALGGGALNDLGCYALHALRTLLRCEPTIESAASVMSEGIDIETRAECLFGRITGSISCSFVAAAPEATLRIVGERGSITLENYVAPQLGNRLVAEVDGRSEVQSIGGPDSYSAQLDHVIEVLNGRAAPLTGNADAIANAIAIEAVRSARVCLFRTT